MEKSQPFRAGCFRISLTACLFFICILYSALVAHAGSPVWKISHEGHHLYLGGTVHVLSKSDYPLPKAFDTSYGKADVIVFETNIEKSRTPEFGKIFLSRMVYSDNRSLKQLLTEKTFQDLERFVSERGIPIESMNKFKPGMVLAALTMAEMKRLGGTQIGVDEYYFQKAVRAQKQMHFLESPGEQISFLENLGVGRENEMIAYILADLADLPKLLPVMKRAWRTGDLSGLNQSTILPLKEKFPRIHESLMVQRNLKWLPRIREMLKTPEVEFVLVGAAHLAGDQGLITLLTDQGALSQNQ